MTEERASQTALELRSPSGGSVSVPTAIIVALITLGGVLAQRCAPPSSDAPAIAEVRSDVKALGEKVEGIRTTQAAMLERLNRADDEAKNAKLIEALAAGKK
jgi:hypothetical protein